MDDGLGNRRRNAKKKGLVKNGRVYLVMERSQRLKAGNVELRTHTATTEELRKVRGTHSSALSGSRKVNVD